MIIDYATKLDFCRTLEERQISYETLYDKKQIRKLIQSQFPSITDKLILDIIYVLCLKGKRLSISAIVEMIAERTNLDKSVENIVQMLFKLHSIKFLEMSTDEKKRIYFKANFILKQDVLDLIHQYQYKLPMLVKPLPLNKKGNNKGNGYYLNGSDSLILNNHHTYDIDHKVLERFNSISFTINQSLMMNIQNSWKSKNQERNELKQQEFDDNFERYERTVIKNSAILVNNGNKFYFTHKYDKRGRIYCCGYSLNYQGNSYAKAQLELSNKQLITEEVEFF